MTALHTCRQVVPIVTIALLTSMSDQLCSELVIQEQGKTYSIQKFHSQLVIELFHDTGPLST